MNVEQEYDGIITKMRCDLRREDIKIFTIMAMIATFCSLIIAIIYIIVIT